VVSAELPNSPQRHRGTEDFLPLLGLPAPDSEEPIIKQTKEYREENVKSRIQGQDVRECKGKGGIAKVSDVGGIKAIDFCQHQIRHSTIINFSV
jgi:hypothetical protein